MKVKDNYNITNSSNESDFLPVHKKVQSFYCNAMCFTTLLTMELSNEVEA